MARRLSERLAGRLLGAGARPADARSSALSSTVSSTHVSTRCVRALKGLLGARPMSELLPQESGRTARAILTDRVIEAVGPVPWPAAISRQLDPDDPAFLPPLGMHLVLSARDRTRLSLPGRSREAWVDPLGWCGFGDGPSVAVWFAAGRVGYPVGRRPDEREGAPVTVEQKRSDDGHGILTLCHRDGLQLEVFHWPVVLQGRTACAVFARLTLRAAAPRPVRLGFAMRPVGLEGVDPLFQLRRDAEGLWWADGAPLLVLSRPGDEILTGSAGKPDPWLHFSGLSPAGSAAPAGPLAVECPAGLATATEVYRATLSPEEPFSCFGVVSPPPEAPPAVVRTSGRALWRGAIADRKGVLAAGARIELVRHAVPFDAARLRVLIADPDGGTSLAGCLGAVALTRLGFVRRAGQRIGDWLARVRRDGRVPGAVGEEPAVLAWAAAEYARWSGERAWVREHLAPWKRLLDRIAAEQPQPGGAAFFGPDGSLRWSSIWKAAALLHGVVALREVVPDHARWGLAGGRAREDLAGILGEAPWSAAEGRAVDGSAAGMLAAAWLGLMPADHPGARATAAYLREHLWHGGGVILRGGAHPTATALLLAVQQRLDPGLDAVGPVAALASPTGAFPQARHPARGALGEGDDLLSAAMFLLLALDAVRATGRTLHVSGRLLRSARDLPTPFGRIDFQNGRVTGRWRADAPEVVVD